MFDLILTGKKWGQLKSTGNDMYLELVQLKIIHLPIMFKKSAGLKAKNKS